MGVGWVTLDKIHFKRDKRWSGVSLFGGASLFLYKILPSNVECKFPCTVIQYVKVPMPAHRFKSSDWSIL